MDRPDPQEGSGSSSQCASVLSPRPAHRRTSSNSVDPPAPPPLQPTTTPPPPCRTRFTSLPRLFHLRENKTPPATLAGSFTVFRGAPICRPTRYFDRARKVKCNQLPGQDKVRPPPLLPSPCIPLSPVQCTVSGNAAPYSISPSLETRPHRVPRDSTVYPRIIPARTSHADSSPV